MWACLSLLSLCSSASAQALRLAAAAAPTPRPRRRSSRHLAEPLTPSRLSTLLTCPVRTATSPSSLLLLCRHLPSSCCWCLALAIARSFTRMWIINRPRLCFKKKKKKICPYEMSPCETSPCETSSVRNVHPYETSASPCRCILNVGQIDHIPSSDSVL